MSAYRCNSLKSSLTIWAIVLAALLNSSCAAVPALPDPYYTASRDGMQVMAWPVANSEAGSVWNLMCVTTDCPDGLPGKTITATVLEQIFDSLKSAGWQIVSRSGSVLTSPAMVPAYIPPEILEATEWK